MEINNRKAKYNYQVLDKIEAGIVLTGTEIKSIRSGKANIKDSYASVIFNHDETRTRKLLLHKNEILKLNDKVRLEGFTLVPLKVYLKRGKAKVLIGICKGKKSYDKREDIKKRDIERELRSKLKK